MLKITINEEATVVTLKLEGSLAGPWVAEFDRTWHALAPSLDSKKLSLDLREVTFIDADGRRLLADISKKTGTDFQTDSLFIDFLVQEAKQRDEKDRKENTK